MAHEIFVKDTVTGACGFAQPICPVEIASADNSVTVTAGGTPSAPTYDLAVPADTNSQSTLTNLIAGHVIGTHDNGGGTVQDISETVTVLNANPIPNVVLNYSSENNTVTNILAEAPRVVQSASFFENRLDPIGTLYSAWVAAMPIQTVTVANPWANRSALVAVQGSVRPAAGWGGANGGFDARATVRAAGGGAFNTVAVANIETIPNLVEGGGGDEQFEAHVAVIAPGGTVDLEFQLGGFIPIDAGATQANQQIVHTYIVSLERFVA